MKKKARKSKGPGTYPRVRTHPAVMGCGGKGKPPVVIDHDRVMEYVGIGWIEIRTATATDRQQYPRLVGNGTED